MSDECAEGTYVLSFFGEVIELLVQVGFVGFLTVLFGGFYLVLYLTTLNKSTAIVLRDFSSGILRLTSPTRKTREKTN